MFRLSRLLISALLLIACSCSVEEKKADKDLFLGSGDSGGTVTLPFMSVTPLKGGNVEYELFEHFFNIGLSNDIKSQGCTIDASPINSESKTPITSESKTCLVEINELDSHLQGLKLEINVPPQMCKYVALDNYWYYNYEVGKGPESVAITQTITEAGTTYRCVEGCGKEASLDTAAGVLSCAYDYTNSQGPNCCLGSYSLTITVIESGKKPQRTAQAGQEWGGDLSACISGPATTNSWPQKEKDGHTTPARVFHSVESGGLKTQITILPPVDQKSRGNVFAANFYTGALNSSTPTEKTKTHPHFRSRSIRINGKLTTPSSNSKLPRAIDPIADNSGDPLPIGNDAYRVLCLDEAYEVLQQINVYVREWNTRDKYTEYVTDVTNISPEPDVEGREGSDTADCGRFSSNNPCNDFSDWDDSVDEDLIRHKLVKDFPGL
ncbi:MAG: hypothetical protein HAW63_05735 [Bdellovibrionaceae bacterium]|nr:hypothetical protein [Pseudobdellovibrionaceae bacterium]